MSGSLVARPCPSRLVVLTGRGKDEGSAIIEFVFGAILVFVPLIYLIVAVAALQRNDLAVTNAARDVGRAIASGVSDEDPTDRARAALRISLANHGLTRDDVDMHYVPGGAACSARGIEPSLLPGSVFAVCVSRRVTLPAVPSIVGGKGITAVGKYVVHVDDYRVGAS